ncbi:MAG: hypothetical protein ACYTHM_18355, partial [Planctomycetota bacterium]
MAIRQLSWFQRNNGKVAFLAAVVVAVVYALIVVAGQGKGKQAVDDVMEVSAALKKRIDAE